MSARANASSDASYLQVVHEYLLRVRHYSPAAAECIEQIQSQFGARAAYLAGFALIMLKDYLNRTVYSSLHNALKTFSYYDEMQGNPDAIRLYEEAAEQLLSPR
jgi:hypothetical protein